MCASIVHAAINQQGANVVISATAISSLPSPAIVTIRAPPLICPEDDLRAAAGLTTTYRMAQNKQDYLTFRPS